MDNQATNDVGKTEVEETKTPDTDEMTEKLEKLVWGLFFIWIGTAFLMEVSISIGLLGIGAIILGEQGARKFYNIKLENFWLVAGLVLVAGSLWDLFESDLPLVPILLIVAGAAIIVSVFVNKS
jgi:hypothetical protein